MAAKFSMASGMFGAADHAEASNRMGKAMDELRERQEQKEHVEEIQRQEDMKKHAIQMEKAYEASIYVDEKKYGKDPSEQNPDVDESDDEDYDDLLNDPEIDRLRQLRLTQLKKEHEERVKNIAKGHGEYREITQDEFLKEVTGSERVIVHFYHNDFEKCKVIDKHLRLIAPHHTECKFLYLNAEKAPFFVEKLMVRVLPSIICFVDGIAQDERVIGFEGLTNGLKRGCEAEFKTGALVRKLVKIGIINGDSKYDSDGVDSDED